MEKESYVPEWVKEETKKHTVKKRLKQAMIVAGLVGGAYLLGGIKGLDIGRRIGLNQGRIKGYEDAVEQFATIVKDAKANVE